MNFGIFQLGIYELVGYLSSGIYALFVLVLPFLLLANAAPVNPLFHQNIALQIIDSLTKMKLNNFILVAMSLVLAYAAGLIFSQISNFYYYGYNSSRIGNRSRKLIKTILIYLIVLPPFLFILSLCFNSNLNITLTRLFFFIIVCFPLGRWSIVLSFTRIDNWLNKIFDRPRNSPFQSQGRIQETWHKIQADSQYLLLFEGHSGDLSFIDDFYESLVSLTPIALIVDRIAFRVKLCSAIALSSFICLIINLFLNGYSNLIRIILGNRFEIHFDRVIKWDSLLISGLLFAIVVLFHLNAQRQANIYWRYLARSCLLYLQECKEKQERNIGSQN